MDRPRLSLPTARRGAGGGGEGRVRKNVAMQTVPTGHPLSDVFAVFPPFASSSSSSRPGPFPPILPPPPHAHTPCVSSPPSLVLCRYLVEHQRMCDLAGFFCRLRVKCLVRLFQEHIFLEKLFMLILLAQWCAYSCDSCPGGPTAILGESKFTSPSECPSDSRGGGGGEGGGRGMRRGGGGWEGGEEEGEEVEMEEKRRGRGRKRGGGGGRTERHTCTEACSDTCKMRWPDFLLDFFLNLWTQKTATARRSDLCIGRAKLMYFYTWASIKRKTPREIGQDNIVSWEELKSCHLWLWFAV